MNVYDKCLSSPLTVEDTKDMCEHMTIATSVTCLMKNIDNDYEIEAVEIQNLGELLRALLSHPMEASTHILHEKWDTEKGKAA